MWDSRHLSTLARNGRSSSYIDRTPKSCPGSWDAPVAMGVEIDGEWVLVPVCRGCWQYQPRNDAGVVQQHRRVA